MGCGITNQKKSATKITRRLSDAVAISPWLFMSKKKGNLPSQYKEIKKLGAGAFAVVKLCKYLPTGHDRAVKVIHKSGLHQQQIDSEFMLKEISVLTSLDHPNILRCYEIFEDPLRFYVSMEYCEGGQLFEKIISLKKFNEQQAAQIMHQLLSAICYCHEKLVIHRDLKPENILLDDQNGDLTIKVADFGSSCFLDPLKMLNGCFGSAYYIAPEVLEDEYNEKCDIWSCGVIMFILLTGKPPYPGKDPKFILNLVKMCPLKITQSKVPGVSLQAVDLLQKMLEVNPRMRISAKEAVNHPWISNYKTVVQDNDLSDALHSLEKFNGSAKLKDAVHVFIATQVASHEEIKFFRNTFKALDKNSDGKISKEELLEKYKENMEESQAIEVVEKIMKEVDTNLNGEIDYSEFLSACMNYSKYLSKENLETAFRMFDKDDSGGITVDEIRHVMGKKTKLPEAVWEEVLKDADENGDGIIDMMEFVNLMTNRL
ncbi:hypothetical protein SteCoe_11240 [Stentor coeruleus]|uniref:non-specific serine/threonine protein kinase n=1 Tax=Stentor coeruleus TaxID=5963 RepID=A0A1R2CDK7_9CILI|nr:hypothetical protein SteCoe_11240 [Stentor coeruleus]